MCTTVAGNGIAAIFQRAAGVYILTTDAIRLGDNDSPFNFVVGAVLCMLLTGNAILTLSGMAAVGLASCYRG